jgi:hypothetical protein
MLNSNKPKNEGVNLAMGSQYVVVSINDSQIILHTDSLNEARTYAREMVTAYPSETYSVYGILASYTAKTEVVVEEISELQHV